MSTPNGMLSLPASTRLLGEVLSWTCPAGNLRHADVVTALQAAELDASVARELAPRNAFTRACKKLAQDRIIRQLAEDERSITFQFTSEARSGDRFEYTLETLLTLDKHTGKITCDLPGLATLAQEHLDQCLEVRNGSDLTRIIQRLFERQADLFPIRDRGGVYFCPVEHAGFIDRVQRFLGRVNGKLARFPVPAGTRQGDRSVKEAVASGLAELIREHHEAIEGFGEDTRPDTLKRSAERLQKTRFKLSAYSAYLQEERERLERTLQETARLLEEKFEQVSVLAV